MLDSLDYQSRIVSEKLMISLLDECTQLCNILGKSVVTARGILS